MSSIMLERFLEALLQTLAMVGISALLSFSLGLPLAIMMVVTAPGGISPRPRLYALTALITDGIRSTPFIILLVLLIPVTRWLLGSAIGVSAAIVPLTMAVTPYFARITEISLQSVDRGLIEAAQAMGFRRRHIIHHVLLGEAAPGIVSGMVIVIITLFNTSAIAGALGAGGLGDLAIRYGYQRYDLALMAYVVVLLLVLVMIIQRGGDRLVKFMRRNR